MPYTEAGSGNVYPIFGLEGLPLYDRPNTDREEAAKDLADILDEFDLVLEEQAAVLGVDIQEPKHELAA
ncbi:MAG TPA: hypothetical protein VLA92_01965 [Candidatus Saccharimonadales bacterium]|nr:hypothetical protein [Candidatus Saccharimonadales bacterium]